MLPAFEPRLQRVPTLPVGFFGVLFGEGAEHPPRLLADVFDD
jgi:hypothetical protein